MVPRSPSLWYGPSLRLWPRFRTHADVCHRHFEHSRRDSLRAHARQRRGLKMPALESARRLPYPCELELGTAQVLQHELVARKFHQVNCRRERCLDFDSVLTTELISAADVSDEDGAVTRKFPNRLGLIFSSRHPPFADDAGLPAAEHNKKQNC